MDSYCERLIYRLSKGQEMFNKSIILWILIAFLAVSSLIGCGQDNLSNKPITDNYQKADNSNMTKKSTGSNFLIYDNPSERIKIKYPSDWMEEDIMGIGFFFHPRNNQDLYSAEGVMITPGVFDNPITLEEYSKKTMEIYKNDFPDMIVVDSSKTMIAGSPAKKLIVSYKDENHDVETMFIWTIKNDKMYMVAYSAEQKRYSILLETAEEMINSFEID